MLLQCAGQASEATAGGIAADTGIDHPITVTFSRQLVLQKGHPGLLFVNTVPCAQTIADNQNGLVVARRLGCCAQ